VKQRENIWLRAEQPARGPRLGFSRAEMTQTAIAIADAEGLDAVSMRRLAAELGVRPMALYSYVTGKDEIIDLMVDAVTGEDLPPDAPSGDWRAELRGLAERSRAAIHRHPWMAPLAAGRVAASPNRLRVMESALAGIDNLGLSMDEMLTILGMLFAYVNGYVQTELADAEAQRRTGLDLKQWMLQQLPYIQTVIASGDYPMFTRMTTETGRSLTSSEERWTYGLEHLLDSIEAHLPTAT
jgi:AcrR family transcriptional regulator